MSTPEAPKPPIAPKAREPGKLASTASLLFIVGAIFFAVALASLYRENAARSWPSVEGRITSSQVVAETGERTSAATGRTRTSTHYSAEVRYEYRVGERTYQGDRISRLDVAGVEEAPIEALVARYPTGSVAPVFYDPDDPAEAMLEVDLGSSSRAPLLFAGSVLLVGLVLRLAARFERRPPLPTPQP